MKVKKTKLLVAELEMIADTLPSKHCHDILDEAAQRLHDLDTIAKYYRDEAERLALKVKRGKRR